MVRSMTATAQLEKLEKRRMGLMLLNIAVAAYIGSHVIADSGVPLIAFMGSGVFSQL